MKILAIIPARAGSKGIPDKNIARVAGKPLIAYTIQTAANSNVFDRIIVSTDSKKIAKISESLGAEIPFLRPKTLAQDKTPGIFPILHGIRWLAVNQNYHPDYIMCLQPTSPLRSSVDIKKSILIALQKKADSVISVSPVERHPYWMKKVDKKGRLFNFVSSNRFVSRRQLLPAAYALNGSIYLARREILVGHRTWYMKRTYAYVMPRERSLDIDTPWDLHLANLILRTRSR